jgi:hypothetical protein
MGISGTSSFPQQTLKVLCSFGRLLASILSSKCLNVDPSLGNRHTSQTRSLSSYPSTQLNHHFSPPTNASGPSTLKPLDLPSPLIPELPQIDSWVWDTQHPQVAHHHKPLLLTLKDPTIFVI